MDTRRPLIVFVHGAWHRPSHYSKLTNGLRELGYEVFSPANATAGDRDAVIGKTYHDDVQGILDGMTPYLDAGREAVLVCHSYGGVPASKSAEGQTVKERAARGLPGGVRAMVYIASLTLSQDQDTLLAATGGMGSGWFNIEVKLPYLSSA
jgi:pimeloyl-ACP methyl ester carboxylesterase